MAQKDSNYIVLYRKCQFKRWVQNLNRHIRLFVLEIKLNKKIVRVNWLEFSFSNNFLRFSQLLKHWKCFTFDPQCTNKI